MQQLIACGQMDTDANHGGKERVMHFPMYHHAVQPVIVEYLVPCKVLRSFDERDKEYYFRNHRFADLPEE